MNSVYQFGVRTLEVAGLGSALQALRLPFGKEARSVVNTSHEIYSNSTANGETWDALSFKQDILLHPKDKKLIETLVKRGDEHSKVLRGVMVWCEINAPRYWWVEMDTYRIGAKRLSSESTMHIQGKGMSEEELVEFKEHLEEGHMQKRVWMFSYQTLRRIYFQRRNHRLPQWRAFCGWIETLPLSQEFITYDSRTVE